MTRGGKNDRKARAPTSRGERLAAALRENLRRRKAQERGRGVAPTKDAPGKPDLAPHNGRTS